MSDDINGLKAELDRDPTRMVVELHIAGVRNDDGVPIAWASARYRRDGYDMRPGLVAAAEQPGGSIDLTHLLTASGRARVQVQPSAGNVDDDVLMRLGRRGSERWARLAATVEMASGATTIEADRSIAGWPEAGYLDIGTETIAYTARTVVAPHRFTVPEGGRAALGTELQRHTVEADESVPLIHDRVVSWGWRPAKLVVSRLRPGGQRHPAEIELAYGWLNDPPAYRRGRFDMTIVGLAAVGETKIGGPKRRTRVQRGLLAFHADDPHRAVRMTATHKRGVYTTVATSIEDGVTVGADSRAHADLFDISLDGVRQGRLTSPLATFGERVPASAAAGIDEVQFDFDDGGLDSANKTEILALGGDDEIDTTVIPDGTVAVEWPGVLFEAFAAERNPGTPAGVDGGWVDLHVYGYHIAADGPCVGARLTTDQHETPLVLTMTRPDRESLWYLACFDDPKRDIVGQPRPLDGELIERQRWWPDRTVEVSLSRSDERARQIIPIRGLARGGWQTGMSLLWVESDIFPNPGFKIRVQYTQLDDTDAVQSMAVVGKAAAADYFETPGLPGVILTIHPSFKWRYHSFGDFPGLDAPVISQHIDWRQRPPAEALLQLIVSVHGTLANGVYDQLPTGGRVPVERVDVDSFLTYTAPGGGAAALIESFDLTKEVRLEEVLGGHLRLLDAMLIVRPNRTTGKLQLALAPAAPPLVTDPSVTVISARRWMGFEQDTGNDSAIVTTTVFELNYEDGDPRLRIAIPDRRAIGENGGREVPQTVSLPGVRAPNDPGAADAIFRPIGESRTARLGQPRRYVPGVLGLIDALWLHPGAPVVVSTEAVHDEKGQREAIVNRPGRVLDITRNFLKTTATVTIELSAFNTSGYAASLRIIGSPSDDKLTVGLTLDDDGFGPAVDSSGAEVTDLRFFAVGDPIVVVPTGRWEDRQELAVRAIDPAGVITVEDRDGSDAVLDPVVRAAPFGVVRTARWADATSSQRTYAHLAGADGELLGGEAFEYS